jgi:hypothetical protein
VTSKKSTGAGSKDQTSSAEASLANPSVLLEEDWRKRIAAGSGLNLNGAYAWYDPITHSWRTFQGCLPEGWEMYSETWHQSGMMLNGIVFQQRPLVPRTYVIGSSSWLTPVARDWKGYTKRAGESICNQLRDLYGRTGKPNPPWIEWLMGFPLKWTDLDA